MKHNEPGVFKQLRAEIQALERVGNPGGRDREPEWRPAGRRVLGAFAVCAAVFALSLVRGSAAEMDGAAVSTAPAAATLDELTQAVASGRAAMILGWILAAAFLVMFMQAGFGLVATGLCRAKSAAHVMTMNLMVYGLGMLGFWVCGFALMFGGFAHGPTPIGSQLALGEGLRALDHEWAPVMFGHRMGLLGGKGFLLDPTHFGASVFALFLFQVVFLNIAAAIPTGAMAERWNFRNFMLYGFWAGALPFAIYGNWVWGGGWLAQLGQNFGLGHGLVDFAGSLVVHLCGGMIALAGAFVLGPRLASNTPQRAKPRPIPGHNLVYVMLGTLILAFGWFGMNSGSGFSGPDNRVAVIAFNTMLAAAASGLGSYFTLIFIARQAGSLHPLQWRAGGACGNHRSVRVCQSLRRIHHRGSRRCAGGACRGFCRRDAPAGRSGGGSVRPRPERRLGRAECGPVRQRRLRSRLGRGA